MVLWRKGFKSFVSYRIPLSIKHTVVSPNRTGMTINLPSASSPLKSSRRELHTTPEHDPSLQDKYEELNDLLSDSDGWDEDLDVEPVQASHKKQVKNAQYQSSRVASEFSDADDSIISEFLKSAKNTKAGLEKQLAGASTKSSRKPPARSSFSSLVSEEYRRPLVESTQQGGLYSSEDSRLLLSLLRGDNSDRQEEDCIQQSSQNLSIPSSDGIVEQLESANINDERAKNIVPIRTPRVTVPKINIPKIDIPDIDISQCIKIEDASVVESVRESKAILGPPKIPNMLECSASKIPKMLERSAPKVPNVSERSAPKISNIPEQSTPKIPNIPEQSASKIPNIPDQSAPNNHGSKRCLQDDHSLMITEEQEKVQFAEKFTLLTQRNCIQNTQEIESRLKLNPKGKVMIPVRLSKEQEDVIRLAEAGHNIFYTGSAGTGKSVLLREMIKVLKDVYGHDQVAVTASTGLAACNIGGVTLHSFAGVGLGHGEVTKVYRKVRRSRKHVKRWESVSALVIDEISMLDGELLDKLDFIAQKIRKNHKPFGDIQLIFCGDFFQLPPVNKDPNNSTKFAFESNVWKEGIDVTIMLTKVFRQQGDSKFIEMLNKMRLGQIDAETEREFKKLSRPLPQDEIIPAELYSTRNEVERANYQRLNRLPGKAHVFHAIDGGVLEDREMKEKLLQNFLAPKELQLKIGAQVMMIKNIDATLVNGSLGKVIDFIDPETYMFYETVLRNPDLSPGALAKLKDNPELLRETWNEFCEESESDTPVRQKTIKDNFCRGDPDESVAQLGESIFDFLKDASSDDIETRTNLDRKRELLKQVHESSKGKRKLPLVRFKTSDMSTRTILVEPESWAIEDENEKALVSRVQLPLMLAWSLSIHKSQGQTLPKVKVDLRRVFEKGQAYVALSRAVSREGLQVLNFDKTRINAHQKVIDFYGTLVTVEHAIKRLQTEAGSMGSCKKRKVSTGPAIASSSGRARQTRSRSKTPTNAVSSPSGIATMLMQRVSRENRQADR